MSRSSRSRKQVNYYEPEAAAAATDTDESDFEPFEEEVPVAQKQGSSRERKPRATSNKPSSHLVRKPAARSEPVPESKPTSKGSSSLEPENGDASMLKKATSGDGPTEDPNTHVYTVDDEHDEGSRPSLGKQVSQAGSDMSIKTDCTADTKVVESKPSTKRPRGYNDSSDDEDAYSGPESDNDFDSESEFGDDNCIVVIGKKKGSKVAKKTTAKALPKPASRTAAAKTAKPAPVRATSIASKPTAKRPSALPSKPLTPTLSRQVRSSLSSSGSSSTLVPVSPRKIGGGGLRGGKNNAPLSSLLGGSGLRRVGLTRTKPLAKKD